MSEPSAPSLVSARQVTPQAALLVSPVRNAILDALEAGGPAGVSAQELADRLDLHVTTIRFHLDQLIPAGLVSTAVERPHGAGRPRKLYALAPGAAPAGAAVPAPAWDPAGDQPYHLLSEVLLEQVLEEPDPGAAAEQAGLRWGRRRGLDAAGPRSDPSHSRSAGEWLGTIGRMVDLLAEWGYSPEVTTSDAGRVATVSLRDCPFAALAREHEALVCGIHKGLIRGLMEALGESSTDVELAPFVTPDLCLASLTSRQPFTSTRGRTTYPHKEIDT